jgi:hypothetical protein
MMLQPAEPNTASGLAVEVETYRGASVDLLIEARALLDELIAILSAPEFDHMASVRVAAEYGCLMDGACEGLARYVAVKDCRGNA